MKRAWKSGLGLASTCAAIALTTAAQAQTQATTPVTNASDAAPGVPQTSTQSPTPDQGTATTAPQAPGAASTKGTTGLADIVVTAQRRSENLQNVPIAITALSPQTLAIAGVATTTDLTAVTPALNFNTNLGGFGQPRIRGVGTTATGPGIENPTATYIDGVYIGTSAGALLALNDVEQIAVLKGPQGTLFGRNATGGLIQITSRAPSAEPHAEVQFGYSNYNTASANAFVTGGTDALAASATILYENQQDGFGTNLYTGQDVQTHRTFASRAKLQWTPDALTKVALAGDYAETSGADPAIRTYGLRNSGYPPFGPGELTPGGKYDIDTDTQPYFKSTQWGTSLTAQREIGAVQLLSISAYRDSYFTTNFDSDSTPYRDPSAAPGQSELSIFEVQTDKQFSQELQLSSKSSGPFKWVGGLFYFHSVGKYDPLSVVGPFLHLFTPTFPLGAVNTYVDQRLNSYAGYVQGTYQFGESTNFTAGLRYTSDHRHINQYEVLTVAGFPVPQAPEVESKTFDKLTWRFALDHRFSPELLAYVSYNRGFKSGSFAPNTVPLLVLKPETLDAYEAGIKADLFDHRVRLNVSGYYYDQQNLQVNQILQGVLNVYNASGARSFGADADLAARLFSHFTLNAGASYIHARYKSFTNAFALYPQANGGDSITKTFDATGQRLQNTPDYTLNVGGAYDVPLSSGKMTVAANYYRNGGYYADPQNRTMQPAYDLVDASISWLPANEHLIFRVWGKNLTNTFYTAQINPTDFGDNYVAAPPRTYGATIGFKF